MVESGGEGGRGGVKGREKDRETILQVNTQQYTISLLSEGGEGEEED